MVSVGTVQLVPNKEANALLDAWITRLGCPVRIHSDHGKEFQNSIWHQVCDRLQIQKTTTPAYNPQSNIVECFNRSLNSIMRTHLACENAGWSRFLSPFVPPAEAEGRTTTSTWHVQQKCGAKFLKDGTRYHSKKWALASSVSGEEHDDRKQGKFQGEK